MTTKTINEKTNMLCKRLKQWIIKAHKVHQLFLEHL